MKKAACLAAFALWALHAAAEQKLGVEVYPGAVADAAVTRALQSRLRLQDAGAYRTADPVARVAQFYRAQRLKEESSTPAGAMFTGKGVAVTIQSPWTDPEKGVPGKDTLISIVRN